MLYLNIVKWTMPICTVIGLILGVIGTAVDTDIKPEEAILYILGITVGSGVILGSVVGGVCIAIYYAPWSVVLISILLTICITSWQALRKWSNNAE